MVQRPGHHGSRAPVAAELRLEGLDGRRLGGDVSPLDAAPLVNQVAPDPGDDLGAQPGDVVGGVVAARVLALGVGGARRVDDVDQRVGVAQIVQELVAQPIPLVRARDQAGHVEELDGHAAAAVGARAVVWPTPVRQTVARAGAVDLEIADGALRVDGGESGRHG